LLHRGKRKALWLHIALGRDLNADGSVEVLGTQLEEVIEQGIVDPPSARLRRDK